MTFSEGVESFMNNNFTFEEIDSWKKLPINLQLGLNGANENCRVRLLNKQEVFEFIQLFTNVVREARQKIESWKKEHKTQIVLWKLRGISGDFLFSGRHDGGGVGLHWKTNTTAIDIYEVEEGVVGIDVHRARVDTSSEYIKSKQALIVILPGKEMLPYRREFRNLFNNHPNSSCLELL